MDSADVVVLLHALAENGIVACVGGGWGVDALLGEQTRRHGDLDLWIPATAFDAAIVAFVGCGVDRLYPWGDDRPWNFVLHDQGRRRVGLHLYEQLTGGSVHYGGVESGETFPADALRGEGTIAGRAVRCEAPSWAVRWHTGYPPRHEDHHDVTRLCAKFGIDLPPAFRLDRGGPTS